MTSPLIGLLGSLSRWTISAFERSNILIATEPVLVPFEDHAPISTRLCVVRKSQTAIALAQKKLRRYASKHGTKLQPETLVYAQYVMVLTTFPAPYFSLQQVLDHYRFRWQIELVFKRFKQIAQLGHLPKFDQDSAKAWLYGKLFVTLLTEKLIQHARAIPPWGYPLAHQTTSQPMAWVFLCISPNHRSNPTGPCSGRHAGKLGQDRQRLGRSASQAQIAGTNILPNKLALMRLCRWILTVVLPSKTCSSRSIGQDSVKERVAASSAGGGAFPRIVSFETLFLAQAIGNLANNKCSILMVTWSWNQCVHAEFMHEAPPCMSSVDEESDTDQIQGEESNWENRRGKPVQLASYKPGQHKDSN